MNGLELSMLMYREGNDTRRRRWNKKTRRNAGLWEMKNEEWTGADG